MNNRNLPAIPTRAEQIGYKILRALDRLGFVHKNRDGSVFTVRFSDAALFSDKLAMYCVDVERLWHFSIDDLTKKRVITQLSAVCGYPVKALTKNGFGLAYLVLFCDEPKNTQKIPSVKMLSDVKSPGKLQVPIGNDGTSDIWVHLNKFQHAMIVGATGSGKSTWLHSAIASIVQSSTPNDVKLLLIDPKRSELTLWRDIDHVIDVVVDTDKASLALSDMVNEINRRCALFDTDRVRNIESYNCQDGKHLPYIIVVIDECLDLALDNDKSILRALKSISIKGRSCGIYLWAATQHGTAASSLPRVMNVNLLSRVVFRVADESAARNAGCQGAHTISRSYPGRMKAKIFDGEIIDYQAFFVPDEELVALSGSLSKDTHHTGQKLSTEEKNLVQYAIENLGGAFSINRLSSSVEGWSNYAVDQLARRLEGNGLLIKNGIGRKVTPELHQMVIE